MLLQTVSLLKRVHRRKLSAHMTIQAMKLHHPSNRVIEMAILSPLSPTPPEHSHGDSREGGAPKENASREGGSPHKIDVDELIAHRDAWRKENLCAHGVEGETSRPQGGEASTTSLASSPIRDVEGEALDVEGEASSTSPPVIVVEELGSPVSRTGIGGASRAEGGTRRR